LSLIMIVLRAILFYFLSIVFWVTGTLFHGFLWWSLGMEYVPAFLPFAHLAFLPFAFFLSWLLVFRPRTIHCEACLALREAKFWPERGRGESRGSRAA
jgi:hypothetical protein